jgi:hypothetical protein
MTFLFDTEPTDHHVEVVAVRLRLVAGLLNSNGQSRLDLTHVHNMRLRPTSKKSNGKGRMVRAFPSYGNAEKGMAPSWYEASISSTEAEELLKENEYMEFGEEASWIPTTIAKESVLKAMFEPAIHLINKMDGVGCTDNNQQDGKLGGMPPRQSTSETVKWETADGYVEEFW